MRFVEAVRTGQVPNPLRGTFTKARWSGGYERLREDDADTNLYVAGQLIYSKMTKIRQSLRISTSADLNATTKIRTLLCLANRDFSIIRHRTTRALHHEFAGRRVKTVAALRNIKLEVGDATYSPDELLEAIVDGIKTPLKFVLGRNPDLRGNVKYAKVNWEDVTLEYNLGILFNHIEELWDDLLWNDYRVRKSNEALQFRPNDDEWMVRYRVTMRRLDNLFAQFLRIAT
jgi:hypothetical protein